MGEGSRNWGSSELLCRRRQLGTLQIFYKTPPTANSTNGQQPSLSLAGKTRLSLQIQRREQGLDGLSLSGMERSLERPEADEHCPLLSESSASRTDIDIVAAETTSELRLLIQYSLPLIATYLLQYSFFVILTIVAGHLGPNDLAAASIGITTMNVVGLAILEGMATALDTLCAQAYGAGNHVGVGLHIQKMLILMGLATVPIGVFWICSPWVLPHVVKQHRIAVQAGSFLRYSLLGLPGYGAFEALKRFMQAQGNTNAGMVVLIICGPINAVYVPCVQPVLCGLVLCPGLLLRDHSPERRNTR